MRFAHTRRQRHETRDKPTHPPPPTPPHHTKKKNTHTHPSPPPHNPPPPQKNRHPRGPLRLRVPRLRFRFATWEGVALRGHGPDGQRGVAPVRFASLVCCCSCHVLLVGVIDLLLVCVAFLVGLARRSTEHPQPTANKLTHTCTHSINPPHQSPHITHQNTTHTKLTGSGPRSPPTTSTAGTTPRPASASGQASVVCVYVSVSCLLSVIYNIIYLCVSVCVCVFVFVFVFTCLYICGCVGVRDYASAGLGFRAGKCSVCICVFAFVGLCLCV